MPAVPEFVLVQPLGHRAVSTEVGFSCPPPPPHLPSLRLCHPRGVCLPWVTSASEVRPARDSRLAEASAQHPLQEPIIFARRATAQEAVSRVGPLLVHLLVHFGVVRLHAREAKHAADHTGVLGRPVLVTDLLPGPAILHLHVALRHRGALSVGGEDGSDPDVFHLDVQVLGRGRRHQRAQVTFLSGLGEAPAGIQPASPPPRHCRGLQGLPVGAQHEAPGIKLYVWEGVELQR